MTAFLYALGGYLAGSIPFAVVVSRILALPDPRTYGSKNIGATNVLRPGRDLVLPGHGARFRSGGGHERDPHRASQDEHREARARRGAAHRREEGWIREGRHMTAHSDADDDLDFTAPSRPVPPPPPEK